VDFSVIFMSTSSPAPTSLASVVVIPKRQVTVLVGEKSVETHVNSLFSLKSALNDFK
jgi:hypothetical protein